MRRSLLSLPLLLVIAVVAAGCGGGSSSGSGGGSTSTSTSASTSTPASGGGYGGYGGAASKPAAAAPATAVVGTASAGVGTQLVDGQGRSLYLWVADKGATSMCSGECANDWPPVTTDGKPKASGGAKASLLATTKRSDGTLQVTYAGHPLYRFEGDSRPGQIAGQGTNAFGALWWVVDPAGAAIQRSA